MPMNTANSGALTPEEVGELVIQPVRAASVALQTTTTVTTGSDRFRIPLVTDDPNAAWVAEGAEIPLSDMAVGELVVVPAKVAGIVFVSRELAEDSSPEAAGVVGEGLARDIARAVDAAFFGALAAPAPSGLNALVGVQTLTRDYDDLDVFAEAISLAEQQGAQLSTFATAPATALRLAVLKEDTGSAKPLLGADATEAGQRRVLGVPLLTSPAVVGGLDRVWGYDKTRVWTVMRNDVRVEVSRDAAFSSDQVAIKATMRIGFAFPHPASIVRTDRPAVV